MIIAKQETCLVCGGVARLLDVVDFNKSCAENNGSFLPLSGMPVYYALCMDCGFCFAPTMVKWSMQEFSDKVYNDEYIMVDPDYLEGRPRSNAENLQGMFKERGPLIRHLDYGGGNGVLSKALQKANWMSTTYDPFVDKNLDVRQLGQFDLITAYEVFEHVPDANQLMEVITSLLAPNGMVIFSTMLSDGNIGLGKRMTWWYASPRNGHISLHSIKSLSLLGKKHGLKFGTFDGAFHAYFSTIPPWASEIIADRVS